MFLLRRPSADRLGQILADVSDQPLTYDEVGATRGDELPSGYHHVSAQRELGEGEAVFAAAADGLRTWQLHRRQGFLVVPAEPPIATGTVVVSAAPMLPVPSIHVLFACRIVWAVDEPDRFGFAYGTLPVHPASGEESFVVERSGDGRTTLTITAFSAPRHPLMRLGGPIARRQQAAATQGYLDALQAHVAQSVN
jgi:uncharacterized protein (UPF0548 family)